MGYGHQCRRINDCGVGYYETDCILNDVVSDGSVWGNGPALQRLGPVIAVAMVKPSELSDELMMCRFTSGYLSKYVSITTNT